MSHGKHPALAMCEFVKTYEQEGDGMEPATQDIIVRQCPPPSPDATVSVVSR